MDETTKGPEDPELALDLDEQTPDLSSAIDDAVAAVEGVESAHGDPAATPAVAAGELERLRREAGELRDRVVRTLADFENYRKRAERERQDAKRYALFEIMAEVLGVVDHLDLALSAEGPAEDLKRGVEMIRRQLSDLLRRHGVRELSAMGEAFDPAVHEAVSREESAAVSAPTVVAELRRGYVMHDRLLRPAMVKVALPAEASAGAAEPSAGAGAEAQGSVTTE
jgi:molecular chaperone GrpE